MSADADDPPSFWTPGTEILWVYESPSGLPGAVHPMRVVHDDADALVAWLAAGTPIIDSRRADGRDKRWDKATMFTSDRVQVTTAWRNASNLRIAPAGRRWSVWCFFAARTGVFEGWYVNLEEPHRRSANATISRDLVLDVLVDPGRRHRRKDEDELTFAVQQGRFSAEMAREIAAIADEVEAVIDAWGSPFCDGWERFAPDPFWPVPTLPTTGWAPPPAAPSDA